MHGTGLDVRDEYRDTSRADAHKSSSNGARRSAGHATKTWQVLPRRVSLILLAMAGLLRGGMYHEQLDILVMLFYHFLQ